MTRILISDDPIFGPTYLNVPPKMINTTSKANVTKAKNRSKRHKKHLNLKKL
jgi:hypothetical protein